jgi:RES domain-containing protein
VRFWRISRLRYAMDITSGDGSYYHGGRWNSRGVRVVYASTSLALAAVETFVNIEPKLRPPDLVFVEGTIPEDLQVARLDASRLPKGWDESRDESLHRFGDNWIRYGRAIALLVPSAAIHCEWNILLNPAHSRFAEIRVGRPQPFRFDTRMFNHSAAT